MNTDTLLERVLDKIDDLSQNVSALNVKTDAIVQRLDKLNGSVAKHEADLNEAKLWRATHEQTCKPKISDSTILKSVALLCGTALAIFGAQVSGLTEALISLLR